MLKITNTIIAPDTSHWAMWIDAALDDKHHLHSVGVGFYERLLSAGRIPLLSWHHVEELLSIADAQWALKRVAFLQKLPHLAYLRLPENPNQIGSIIDIASAEIRAAVNGATDSQSVRAAAKEVLLQVGSGIDALGDKLWVWEVAREEFVRRKAEVKVIASTRRMQLFDVNRTVGEISKSRIRGTSEMQTRIAEMREQIINHVKNCGDSSVSDPDALALDFMAKVESIFPPVSMNVRQLLEVTLTSQGVDLCEIKDECLLSDLNELGLFRAKLKVIADNLEVEFSKIRSVDMRILPSWKIEKALKAHGQDRTRTFGSDITDEYLAALAPYVDELFVDKRTAEDFRRVKLKARELSPLICSIRKTGNFEDLAIAP